MSTMEEHLQNFLRTQRGEQVPNEPVPTQSMEDLLARFYRSQQRPTGLIDYVSRITNKMRALNAGYLQRAGKTSVAQPKLPASELDTFNPPFEIAEPTEPSQEEIDYAVKALENSSDKTKALGVGTAVMDLGAFVLKSAAYGAQLGFTGLTGIETEGSKVAGEYIGEQTGKALEAGKQFVGESIEQPIAAGPSLVGGMTLALLEPLVGIFESVIGVDLTSDPDFIMPLTPEAVNMRMKNAGATIAMFAVGAEVGKAFGAGERALAGEIATRGALPHPAKIGKLTIGESLKKGLAEGAAGGATYGAIRFANEEDQLSEILINGVIFAPMGSAVEILGHRGRAANREALVQSAQEIRTLRMMQNVQGLSVAQIVQYAGRIKDARRIDQIGRVDRWHGTEVNYIDFDLARAAPGIAGKGIYTTDNPDIASGYSNFDNVVYADHTQYVDAIDILQEHKANIKSLIDRVDDNLLVDGIPLEDAIEGVNPNSKIKNLRIQGVNDIHNSVDQYRSYIYDDAIVTRELLRRMDVPEERNTYLRQTKELYNKAIKETFDYRIDDFDNTLQQVLADAKNPRSFPNTRMIRIFPKKVFALDKPVTVEQVIELYARAREAAKTPEDRLQLNVDESKFIYEIKNETDRPPSQNWASTPKDNKPTGWEVWYKLREVFGDNVNEHVVNAAGYDALHHIGGRGEKTKHNVYVVLDPSILKHKFDPDIAHLVSPRVVGWDTAGELFEDWLGYDARGRAETNIPESISQIRDAIRRLESGKTKQINLRLADNDTGVVTERLVTKEDIKELQDYLHFEEYMHVDKFIDSPLPENYNYTESIKKWMEDNSLPSDNFEEIARDFHDRLVSRILVDREFFPLDEAKLLEELQSSEVDINNTFEDLLDLADQRGFDVLRGDGDNVHILDSETKKLIKDIASVEDARLFIEEAGPAHGIDLGGGELPPTGMNPKSPSKGRGNFIPPTSDGKIETLRHAYNAALPFYSKLRDSIIGLNDTILKRYGVDLKLFEFFDKLQEAKAKATSRQNPWYGRLSKEIESLVRRDKKGKRASSDYRRTIHHYREKDSPSEVARKYKVSGNEARIANTWAKGDHDFGNILDFLNKLDKLEEFYPKDSFEYAAERVDLMKNMGIDAPTALFADDVKGVRDGSRREARLGQVLRMTRAIKENTSKAEFAAKNKMTHEQIEAAGKIDKLLEDFSRDEGFDADFVNEYLGILTHARLYTKGGILTALDHFGSKSKKGYSTITKMANSGNIAATLEDPIFHVYQIIKGAIDSVEMLPHVQEAEAFLKNIERNKILTAEGGTPFDKWVRRNVSRVGRRYLADIQGHVSSGSQLVEGAFNTVLKRFGVKQDVNIQRQWVNAIVATGEAGTQGGRIKQGARDGLNGIQEYYMRFGLERTRKFIGLAAEATKRYTPDELGKRLDELGLDPAVIQELIKSGKDGKVLKGSLGRELESRAAIPSASAVEFDTPGELVDTAVKSGMRAGGAWLQSANKLLFRLSGQKDIYHMLHTGAYVETFTRVGEGLKKYSKAGVVDMQRLSKYVDLHTYDNPVIRRFVELIEANQPEQAAHFLGRQTGYESIQVYGLANAPLYWNSHAGRLLGQFGQWPLWHRNNMLRIMSKGSHGQRVVAATRLGMSNKIVAAAGAALGINLFDWELDSIDPRFLAFPFMGGPVGALAEALHQSHAPWPFLSQRGNAQLKMMLPYNPSTGRFRLGQWYIPGGNVIQDILFDTGLVGDGAADEGLSWPQILGAGIGFRTDPDDPDFSENFLRTVGPFGLGQAIYDNWF